MGKPKGGGSSDGAKGEEEAARVDPETFLRNYSLFSRLIGTKPNEDVMACMNGDDSPPVQISVDADLGPAGTRAIVEALIGETEGMSAPFTYVNTIRLWRCDCRDEGAMSLAKLLTNENMKLTYLQLLDNKISTPGCKALGQALNYGHATTLLCLNLDHNDTMGTEGFEALCKGLRTNSTLKRLSVAFCNIDKNGATSLKRLLSFIGTALENLNLKGNSFQGHGLESACEALLGANKTLQTLDFSDNDVGPDQQALRKLCEMLSKNSTLTDLNMEQNHIEKAGAQVLVDSGVFDAKTGNSTLKKFQVDVKIPSETFSALLRDGGGGGKKGKGKKGKKKK